MQNDNRVVALAAFAAGAVMAVVVTRGSKPSAVKSTAQRLTLYTNPICPFAHRTWLTLVEKGVAFDQVLIPLSGEVKAFKASGKTSGVWASKTPEEVETIKENYKKEINSTGEVPTITYGDAIITEADVCSEFVNDAFPHTGTALFPENSAQRAYVRRMYKVLSGGDGVMALYGFLKNQDPAKDEAFVAKIYKHHAKFAELADEQGPFFSGSTPGFYDLMLAPFYFRFSILLGHYRHFDYIPKNKDDFVWVARLQAWAAAMDALPSLQQTKGATPEDLIRFYGAAGYSGERGVSKM